MTYPSYGGPSQWGQLPQPPVVDVQPPTPPKKVSKWIWAGVGVGALVVVGSIANAASPDKTTSTTIHPFRPVISAPASSDSYKEQLVAWWTVHESEWNAVQGDMSDIADSADSFDISTIEAICDRGINDATEAQASTADLPEGSLRDHMDAAAAAAVRGFTECSVGDIESSTTDIRTFSSEIGTATSILQNLAG